MSLYRQIALVCLGIVMATTDLALLLVGCAQLVMLFEPNPGVVVYARFLELLVTAAMFCIIAALIFAVWRLTLDGAATPRHLSPSTRPHRRHPHA